MLLTILSILLNQGGAQKNETSLDKLRLSYRGGNIDLGIFPLAYFSVFLVVIRSSFLWHMFYSLLSQCGQCLLRVNPLIPTSNNE
jgi:hypothetical protein